MTPAVPCQRWREGRARYRPSGERIRPADYAVELLERDREARAFVCAHHYEGSYPAAQVRAGLFRARPTGSELVGVVVFGVPAQEATVPAWAPGLSPREGVVLSRLVLLDEVPGDGESWTVARALRLLRAELPQARAVISYSDPVERLDAEGRVVKRGHLGVVYQATNARYLGRSKAETVLLDAAGRVVSRRGLSKLRNGERGGRHVYERLLAGGLPARELGEDWTAYLGRVLPLLRRVRHPGQHVYGWSWGGAELRPGLPYPKGAA